MVACLLHCSLYMAPEFFQINPKHQEPRGVQSEIRVIQSDPNNWTQEPRCLSKHTIAPVRMKFIFSAIPPLFGIVWSSKMPSDLSGLHFRALMLTSGLNRRQNVCITRQTCFRCGPASCHWRALSPDRQTQLRFLRDKLPSNWHQTSVFPLTQNEDPREILVSWGLSSDS